MWHYWTAGLSDTLPARSLTTTDTFRNAPPKPMPRLAWQQLVEHATEDDFVRHRATDFCCSGVYATRQIDCRLCAADHRMTERRLECISPSCARLEATHGGGQCGVQWKYWECEAKPAWRVYANDKAHLRGDEVCSGIHRVPITAEVKEFITRMDSCGVRPRHIWSNLRRATDVRAPPLGLPSRQQVSDCVKRLRKKNLTRNTREAVKNLTKEFPYYGGIDSGKAFLFGPADDEGDGHPHIGNGSDENPFVLGVTTLSLLSKVNQLRSDEHFRLFHTDATFKLSDLGHPVITCGFTDRSRVYHLAAILVVSARTHREYELAFGCFAQLYQKLFKTPLRVDAVLGDAEDAQFNALRSVGVFSEAKYLMCFFHVLYNVHKRTRHLDTAPGIAVFKGIMDMHYTTSYTEYCDVKERVISGWRVHPCLRSFADYFEEQWIESRYWRWQVFHSPSSYATTNNPCEVFNATVKRHVHRKSNEICALLRSMITLAEDVGCDVPSPTVRIAGPNVELKHAAKLMKKTKAVAVILTPDASKVRVLHILEVTIDVAAMETMRRLANLIAEGADEEPALDSVFLAKAEKAKAERLYRDSVKWSTRRAHRVNMLTNGWLVDVEENSCGCSIHLKFGVCAHVVVARSVLGLGNGVGEKLVCRRVRKKKRTRNAVDSTGAVDSSNWSNLLISSGPGAILGQTTTCVHSTGDATQDRTAFSENYVAPERLVASWSQPQSTTGSFGAQGFMSMQPDTAGFEAQLVVARSGAQGVGSNQGLASFGAHGILNSESCTNSYGVWQPSHTACSYGYLPNYQHMGTVFPCNSTTDEAHIAYQDTSRVQGLDTLSDGTAFGQMHFSGNLADTASGMPFTEPDTDTALMARGYSSDIASVWPTACSSNPFAQHPGVFNTPVDTIHHGPYPYVGVASQSNATPLTDAPAMSPEVIFGLSPPRRGGRPPLASRALQKDY